jgi:acetyltransferase
MRHGFDSSEYAVSSAPISRARRSGTLTQLIIEYARFRSLQPIEGQVLSQKPALRAMCKELGFDIALDPRDPDTYLVKLAIREPVPIS